MNAKEINDTFNEFFDRATNIVIDSNHYSNWYKGLDIITRISIFITGLIIGGIGIYRTNVDNDSNTMVIVLASLGVTISALEGLKTTFNFANRGLTLRNVYLKGLNLTRKAKTLRSSEMIVVEMEKQLENYHARLDELCNILYDINIINPSSNRKQAELINRQAHRRPTSQQEQSDNGLVVVREDV